ncbi:MAG: putative porin [Deltaproteobacteria bacterium]|nr:putative porin [Deltaproteobacteria bacterium]MBW1922393.1 putative porin [Deltaproteobacteria bacterium]MBW1948429.1 putative porin [Deltaproteobacteria bacterium]MBW2009907.1 putative porin [Deltaproteobacteria bacterium]MBW2104156.1 putative porin [Deltaproteobacteria bacterium]
MKRKIWFFATLFLFVSALGVSQASAGQVDVLINKLVQKGVLTESEARDLLRSLQKEDARQEKALQEVARETAQETVKKEVKSASVDLPAWVKNSKVKGDIRVRYQKEDRDKNPSVDNKDRTRLRVRLGLETRVNEQWKAGIGLASGGSDPRSTNQTLENTFDTPDIRMDYAYAQYQPCSFAKLTGGKFKNPLWKTKDLLWDGDIRPEGAALQLHYDPAKNVHLWATPAYFILENIAGTADPNMVAIQVGAQFKFAEALTFKVAPTFYEFNQVKGQDFTAGGGYGKGTNSEDANGNWLFDHDAWALDAELGVKIPGPVPYFALFGQFVKSSAEKNDDGISSRYGKDDDTGYLVGFKLGHKNVKKLGQWQINYNYRRLENDAWPDWLPDSDFYGGRTNVKGSEYEVVFGLAKNVTLGIDYYDAKPIRTQAVGLGGGLADQDEKVFQADLVLKW